MIPGHPSRPLKIKQTKKHLPNRISGQLSEPCSLGYVSTQVTQSPRCSKNSLNQFSKAGLCILVTSLDALPSSDAFGDLHLCTEWYPWGEVLLPFLFNLIHLFRFTVGYFPFLTKSIPVKEAVKL